MAGISATINVTFLFCWLTFAKEAVTKQELEKALAVTPASTAEFRTSASSRMDNLEEHLAELRLALAEHDKDHKTIEQCSKRVEAEIKAIQDDIAELRKWHQR